MPTPEKVILKVLLHDPVSGDQELVDCRLYRSIGPNHNYVEVIPIRKRG